MTMATAMSTWFWRGAYEWRTWRKRDHEPELRIVAALVDPQRVALDIGANRALYTTVLRRLARKVHSFEPMPHLAARLRSAFPDVEVHEVALSNTSGEVKLRLPGTNTSWATIEPHNKLEKARGELREVTVRMARVDDFPLAPVGFVKVDVEGHEIAVLEGAHDLLARDRPVLLVELEERHTPNALGNAGALLAPLGYAGYFLDRVDARDVLRPLSQFDAVRDASPTHVSEKGKIGRYINNFVFLPTATAGAVTERLRASGVTVD